jgi:hypothetical protein
MNDEIKVYYVTFSVVFPTWGSNLRPPLFKRDKINFVANMCTWKSPRKIQPGIVFN